MNNHEILFDWDGQPIKKSLEELAGEEIDRCGEQCAGGKRAPAAAPASTVISAGQKVQARI